jgi:hypothetical protein
MAIGRPVEKSPPLTVVEHWPPTKVSTIMLAVSITIRRQTHPADLSMVQSAGLIDIGGWGCPPLFGLTILATLADPVVRVVRASCCLAGSARRSGDGPSAPIDPPLAMPTMLTVSLTAPTGGWSWRIRCG